MRKRKSFKVGKEDKKWQKKVLGATKAEKIVLDDKDGKERFYAILKRSIKKPS